MGNRCRTLVLGFGLLLLTGRFGTENGKICFDIVSAAAANQATVVFHVDAAALFGPSPAVSNPAMEYVLRLKQDGDYAALQAIYLEMEATRRNDIRPLDQGGDNIGSATFIGSLPYNDNGSTVGYANDYDGACPAGTAADVVYGYNPSFTQQVVIELCGSLYDTKLYVFENSPSIMVACNDDACGLSSRVTVPMLPGNTYYIVVDGWNTSSGSYVIQVREDAPCDVVPPPDALSECAFETVGPNHGMKDCNGGCNNETIDGQYNLDKFDGICSGAAVKGHGFTYLGSDNSNRRDTDWFLFKMQMPGPVDLFAESEFAAIIGIVNLDNCIAPTFIQATTIPPCTPGGVNVPMLNPGTYAAFIAPSGFSGVPSPLEYTMRANYPTLPPVCVCPQREFEPNDQIEQASVIPGPNLPVCGEIACPMDGDYFAFQMPFASAIRLHLRGDAATGFCPAGQGLHPYCEIVTEDGEPIILAGDQTNASTYFETDFKLGPYLYYFHVGGANYTTGPYEIEIEMIQLQLTSCNPITVTIQPDNGGVRLRWQGGMLPSDMIRIERRTDPSLQFQPLVDVPPIPADFFYPGAEPFCEFQLRVLGGREPELTVPWVGSLLGLGEESGSDGEYNELGDYQITDIEWAVDQQNNCVQTRLRAEGIGVVGGELIDQDRRAMYSQGWQPISSFQGHFMSVNERKVLVEHVAFARDPVHGDIGVVDGRGWNETGDTLMFFGNLPYYLHGNLNPVSEPWFGWLWWWWWDDWFCPGTCCRLKTIAFCTTTGFPTPPGCMSPFGGPCLCNPACWLGCPCPPDPPPPDPANCCGPSVPPAPPRHAFGCDGCTFRVFPVGGWALRYCQCPSDTTPPVLPFCMFRIFVKCKSYCPCPDLFNICGCEVAVCPGPFPGGAPDTWYEVPFSGPAMKAFCRKRCVLGGPGC